MFPSTAILSLLLAAVSTATPIQRHSNGVTLGFVHKVHALHGSKNLAEIDRARASAFVHNAQGKKATFNGKVVSVGVTNTAVTYTAKIGVGSPPVDYTLLIDTGSSNTWVGAGGKKYVKTSSSKNTGGSVSVSYGSGSFSGTEYTDNLNLGPGLTIKGQSIGVASSSTGFDTVNGILGIGPVRLTQGTVSNAKTVPTVTDNLFKAGEISSDELGIFYKPATDGGGSGELTWGGVDKSKVVGSINYVPITKTQPSSHFWGVNQTVTYNGKKILPNSAGIVDTGTTLVLLATDCYTKYLKAVGGTADQATGLIKITSKQYSELKNLDFVIGTHTYSLTPNAQIWPRSLNADIGGDAGSIYLIVGDLGTASGQGLDFINGYGFLERFYSVYDTANHRVGLATTPYTKATTN